MGKGDGSWTSAGKGPSWFGFAVHGVNGVPVIWWWHGECQGSPTDPQTGDRVDLGSIGAGPRAVHTNRYRLVQLLVGWGCVVDLATEMISGLYLVPSFIGNSACFLSFSSPPSTLSIWANNGVVASLYLYSIIVILGLSVRGKSLIYTQDREQVEQKSVGI